jgi:hypothetical protein
MALLLSRHDSSATTEGRTRIVIIQRWLVFALFSAICSSAQEAPKAGNAEVEIRALETVRLKSPNKTEVWSGNVANDALFQLGNGTVASKQDLLAHMHQEVIEDSFEMSDTMFSQIGDVAIFSYVLGAPAITMTVQLFAGVGALSLDESMQSGAH